jgi:hypothetical protein
LNAITMTSNTHTAPADRITSSCWVGKYENENQEAARAAANPSVFQDEAGSAAVPLPSIDPALHLSGLSSSSSSSFKSFDALRLRSMDSLPRLSSIESRGDSFQRTPSGFDWLQQVLKDATARSATRSSERISTVDLLTKTVLGEEEEPTLKREEPAEPKKAEPVKPKAKPAKSRYVTEVLQWDVLSERGGKANHHDGNKRYRKVVTQMKAQYRGIAQKQDKTQLSRSIVEYVGNYGGRFLKKDTKTGKYYEMTPAEARKKTSQALRETKQLKWTQVDVQDEIQV